MLPSADPCGPLDEEEGEELELPEEVELLEVERAKGEWAGRERGEGNLDWEIGTEPSLTSVTWVVNISYHVMGKQYHVIGGIM